MSQEPTENAPAIKQRTLSPSLHSTANECLRAAYFNAVCRFKGPQGVAAARGERVHGALEDWQLGKDWEKHVFAPVVRAMAPHAPAPNQGAKIEEWLPRVALGHDIWTSGRIDYMARPEDRDWKPLLNGAGEQIADGETLLILDWKHKGDTRYLGTPSELYTDHQMVYYGEALFRAGVSKAPKLSVAHGYIVYPKKSCAELDHDDAAIAKILKPSCRVVVGSAGPERAVSEAVRSEVWGAFELTAGKIRPLFDLAEGQARPEHLQDEVPATLSACERYRGYPCDHAAYCTAYQRNKPQVGTGGLRASMRPSARIDARLLSYPEPVKKDSRTPDMSKYEETKAKIEAQAKGEMPANHGSAVSPPDAPPSITPSSQQWQDARKAAHATPADQRTIEVYRKAAREAQLPVEMAELMEAADQSKMASPVDRKNKAGEVLQPKTPNPFPEASTVHWHAWQLLASRPALAAPVLALATELQRTVSDVTGVLQALWATPDGPLVYVGEVPGNWYAINPAWNRQPVLLNDAAITVPEAPVIEQQVVAAVVEEVKEAAREAGDERMQAATQRVPLRGPEVSVKDWDGDDETWAALWFAATSPLADTLYKPFLTDRVNVVAAARGEPLLKTTMRADRAARVIAASQSTPWALVIDPHTKLVARAEYATVPPLPAWIASQDALPKFLPREVLDRVTVTAAGDGAGNEKAASAPKASTTKTTAVEIVSNVSTSGGILSARMGRIWVGCWPVDSVPGDRHIRQHPRISAYLRDFLEDTGVVSEAADFGVGNRTLFQRVHADLRINAQDYAGDWFVPPKLEDKLAYDLLNLFVHARDENGEKLFDVIAYRSM